MVQERKRVEEGNTRWSGNIEKQCRNMEEELNDERKKQQRAHDEK